MTVNSAVSKRLPNDARADVCQDLLLAILEGDLNVCDLIPAVQPAIRRRQDMFSVFRTVSLDAPVGFDDAGRPVTLMETIPENYEPIIAKTLRSAPSMT